MTLDVDLLVHGARVIDPETGLDAVRDVAAVDGAIISVAETIAPSRAAQVIDGRGYTLLPGLIDTHVHMGSITANESYTPAHKRLAVAGVTTAIEFARFRTMLRQWPSSSAGLTVLGIEVLPSYDAGTKRSSIKHDIERAVLDGAVGVKVLGGPFPSTPEATASIIEEAKQLGCYVGFHAGTTNHGSDLDGMREALMLADGNPLHLAHTNAYLRGATERAAHENNTALDLLRVSPQVVSESHLGHLNMCFGSMRDGHFTDQVLMNSLRLGGFAPSEYGLEQAFQAGYAYLHTSSRADPITGCEANALWRETTEVVLSFPVNRRITAFQQAAARIAPDGTTSYDGEGEFLVDAIASDGGEWRNVILDQGLLLVQFGAMTLLQFAEKTTLTPAKMFGLKTKGRIKPGADADLTLVDLERRYATHTIARGKIIARNGHATGHDGMILTMSDGAQSLREKHLPHNIIDLSDSLFMTKGTQTQQ